MVTKNCRLEEFAKRVEGKKLICFGAGVAGQLFTSRLEGGVLGQICLFLDNDQCKWGDTIQIKEHRYPVHSPAVLKHLDLENTVMLITSRFWDQIHAQLEQHPRLRAMECYVYLLMKAEGSSKGCEIPMGPQQIPKKIHYCWFGGAQLSENEIRCMESWKRFCPDYEIIRWDESNYDCRKTRYLKEVYDYGHYSAVSSYARFEILNEIGGLYFDTDVEIVRNIDELLRLPAFMGFEVTDAINTGHGFGTASGNAVYQEIVDYYDSISHFNEKGEFHYTCCPVITSRILERHGLVPDGKIQQIGQITVFSNEYFDPVMQMPVEHTYSVHRYSSLWSLKGMNMAKVWADQRGYWKQLKCKGMIE